MIPDDAHKQEVNTLMMKRNVTGREILSTTGDFLNDRLPNLRL